MPVCDKVFAFCLRGVHFWNERLIILIQTNLQYSGIWNMVTTEELAQEDDMKSKRIHAYQNGTRRGNTGHKNELQ